MAQLALNNNVSETTGMTPFYANFGRNPNLFMTTLPNVGVERAIVNAESMIKAHEAANLNIRGTQEMLTRQRFRINKTEPQLKKGDKVYLLTKNLKTRRKTKKLDHVKVGPFLIAERKGLVNYRLDLPKDVRVHPIFYVSLLEPVDPETTLQKTFYFKP